MAASPIRPWKSLKLKTVTSESGVQVAGELLAWAEPVAALVDGVASLLGELLADALADGAALADPEGAALPVGVLAPLGVADSLGLGDSLGVAPAAGPVTAIEPIIAVRHSADNAMRCVGMLIMCSSPGVVRWRVMGDGPSSPSHPVRSPGGKARGKLSPRVQAPDRPRNQRLNHRSMPSGSSPVYPAGMWAHDGSEAK